MATFNSKKSVVKPTTQYPKQAQAGMTLENGDKMGFFVLSNRFKPEALPQVLSDLYEHLDDIELTSKTNGNGKEYLQVTALPTETVLGFFQGHDVQEVATSYYAKQLVFNEWGEPMADTSSVWSK